MKYLHFLWALFIAAPSFAQKDSNIYFYTGSTNKSGNSPITLCALNPSTGSVTSIQAFNGITAPGYIALSPDRKYLYSVSSQNKINALAVGKDRKLTLLNAQGAEGENPCFVSVAPSGQFVFSANYTSGNMAVFSVGKDGKLLDLIYKEQYDGSGPDKQRQNESHAHCAIPGKDGKSFYVADLGSDRVMNYRIDPKTKTVIPNPRQPFAKVHGGAGPRQLAGNTRNMYLINEMDATVCAFSIGKEGVLTLIGTYPSLPAGLSGPKSAAAIRLHPGGKFLYVSNRGYNSIHGFKVLADGRLQSIGEVREAIDNPRDFNIDPSGKFLLVANLNSKDLAVYRIHPETGALNFTGKSSISLSDPSCIEFF